MNPNVKHKWLAALKSGDYTQGYGQLRVQRHGGYQHCALGVLSEIALEEGVVRPETGWPYGNPGPDHLIAPEILRWAEFDETVEFTIMRINDNYDCVPPHRDENYARVIEYIEEEL